MNLDQFELVKSATVTDPVIVGTDLKDATPRTLIYGFTLERESFHVYLDSNRMIRVLTYDKELIASQCERNFDSNMAYRPSKRAYPETCDFEFCMLLKARGHTLSFATYNANRPAAPFYGRIVEDF